MALLTLLTQFGLYSYTVLLVFICVIATVKLYDRRKPRVPSNLPILKISSLPGKLGEAADIQAFVKNGSEVVQLGYNQFNKHEKYSKNGHNFLMRTPPGLVFVASPRFVEEVRTAAESVLSGTAVNNDIMQEKYTLHNIPEYDWYEFDVVRKQLTQNLGPGLIDIVDECHKAFMHEIKRPTEWVSKHMWPIATRIVTRTGNRQFFGENLSANQEFLQLSIDYTYSVFGGAHLIRDYPKFLRPLILRLKTGITQQRAIAKNHLAPLLQDRIHRMQEADKIGNTQEFEANKPQDAVQWLLDITPPEKLNINMLVDRMLHIGVAAIHTSSITFLETVYELCLHPEIHEELRQEISQIMEQEGQWTKQGLTRMVKIDSFMRETARWHPFVAGGLERQAMRDFNFSDGTTATKGTRVIIPHFATSFDEQVYGPTAGEFDAFRFSKMRIEPGQESRHSFVQCTPTFTHFGYGKRACPGRFFAANEIKVLLVYTLSMYDIRFPQGQAKPANLWYGGFRSADMSLKVEWKLRNRPLLRIDQVRKKNH